jgi:hypothetical protein
VTELVDLGKLADVLRAPATPATRRVPFPRRSRGRDQPLPGRSQPKPKAVRLDGAVLATASVTMSDGSQFAGTLTTSDTNFFAISGLNVVTARALTSTDDGTHTTTITATQGGQAVAAEFSL